MTVMAMIKYKTGKREIIAPKTALAIFRVMNGELMPSKRQKAFIKTVERVYLNRYTAPLSYLQRYPDPNHITEQPAIRLPYKD